MQYYLYRNKLEKKLIGTMPTESIEFRTLTNTLTHAKYKYHNNKLRIHHRIL